MHSLPNVKSSLFPSIHLLQKCRRLARMLRIKRVHFMHETFNSPSCSKWIKMKVMKRYAKVEKFWNSRKRIQGCFVFCRLHKSGRQKIWIAIVGRFFDIIPLWKYSKEMNSREASERRLTWKEDNKMELQIK